MKANEYQAAALRTADFENKSFDDTIINCALGLAGEVGELVDHIKKWKFHGHTLDREYIKKELGDILWYVAVEAFVALHKADTSVGMVFNLDEVMEGNIEKLLERYPEGFSEEASINRKEDVK